MNTSFTKKQLDKYIEVAYVTNVGKLPTRCEFNQTQWCLSDQNADKLIDKIKALEITISKEVSEMPQLKTELIILTYLPVISSIADGLDVRSKLSNEELAENFVSGYLKRYNEAVEFCNKVKVLYEADGKNESYTKYWRDYDKNNELVDEFRLNFKKYGDSDFQINLESMNKKAQELLDELFKENKSNE